MPTMAVRPFTRFCGFRPSGRCRRALVTSCALAASNGLAVNPDAAPAPVIDDRDARLGAGALRAVLLVELEPELESAFRLTAGYHLTPM